MKSRKALIVGINHYSQNIGPLEECVSDATKMADLLSTTYDEVQDVMVDNFECRLCVSDIDPTKSEITRSTLRKKLLQLFQDKAAEQVLFYFSGHGYANSLGGYLVTQDAESYDQGVSFGEVLNLANQSLNKEVYIILDCCKSGHMGLLNLANQPFSQIRTGVHILTASASNQVAIETNKGAVFTNILCNALAGGGADLFGNIKFIDLFRHSQQFLGVWEQRPTFKANTNQPTILRKVEPRIHRSVLNKIREYFPTESSQYGLNRAHEPSFELGDKKKEEAFSHLQTLSNFGLVKPVSSEHMYYAAKHEESCELTPFGKSYWRQSTSQNKG